MTLGDFNILPGVVIDNSDPKRLFRVKVNAPSLFTSDMDKDDIFWVSPFIMFGPQVTSTLNIGDKVWVLHHKNNYYEYWYLPMFDINDKGEYAQETSGLIDTLISRNCDGSVVKVYWSQDEGYVVSINDSSVKLSNDGTYTINTNGLLFDMSSDNIRIGKEDGDFQPSVLGNSLVDAFGEFDIDISSLALQNAGNPYVASLVLGLKKAVEKLSTSIMDNCLSDTVQVS